MENPLSWGAAPYNAQNQNQPTPSPQTARQLPQFTAPGVNVDQHAERNPLGNPITKGRVTVRPTGAADLQQQQNNPQSWGAIPVGGNGRDFDDAWASADGSVPNSGVGPAANQKTALDPEIDRVLAREAPNNRGARVEGHIREMEKRRFDMTPTVGMEGITYGLSSELGAGIRAITGQGKYDELLDAERQAIDRVKKDQPIAAAAVEIGGNLLTLPFTPVAGITKGATFAGRAVNSAATGAGLSGLYGFNTGEGAEDRTNRAISQGLWGGAFGLAGEAAVSGVSNLLRRGFGGATNAAQGVNMPQRIADANDLSVPMTRGQVTGDIKQQAWENAARNNAKGDIAGKTVRAFDDQQAAAIRSAQDDIGGTFGPAATADDAGNLATQAMRDRSALLKQDAENAYSIAANKNAWIAADEVTNLAQRVTQDLETAGIRLDQYGNYPGAQNAMNMLRRVSGFEGAPQGQQVVAQSLQGLEQVRKGLLKIRPGNGEDARALQSIRGQFDNWISDAIDKKLFAGDASALDDLKKARGLWAQYKGMTDAKAGPMKVISRMVNEERTGAEVANWLISSNTVGQAANSARVAGRIKNMVGATSDEWRSIQSATWDRIVHDASGQPRTAQQIAKAITDLTQGKGKALSNIVFGADEITKMQKLAGVIRMTATDQRANNPSRTGYEVVRAMGDKIGLGLAGAAGIGSYWYGDPRFLAIAMLPAMRGASGWAKSNAATRMIPSKFGDTVGELARLPQRAAPALLAQ